MKMKTPVLFLASPKPGEVPAGDRLRYAADEGLS